MIETLSHGITCIDTGYHRAGLAACYLVVDDGEAALIETGTALNLPAILRALTDCGVAPEQLRYIMPTHVHLDHAGGAGALLARCPQATLVAIWRSRTKALRRLPQSLSQMALVARSRA